MAIILTTDFPDLKLAARGIVRGYISGSDWKDYKSTGAVCGIKLPDGVLWPV